MNKKGITLIALIITIIVLLILATVSIVSITRGNIIDRTRQLRNDEKRDQAKETIRAVVNQVVETTNFVNVNELAEKIEEDLQKIKGFESAYIEESMDNYVVYVPDDIEISIQEATGKKLELYIDTYVTINELKGR